MKDCLQWNPFAVEKISARAGLELVKPVLYLPVLHIATIEFVVVARLFYVHGKHLRSCRDGQLT